MTYFTLPPILLALVASCGAAATLGRQSSHKEDPSALAVWTPPPEYGLATTGHKTMYLVDVAIGASGQSFRLLVDTGSSMVIVPGQGCKKRSRQFDTSAAKAGNRTISIKFGLGSVAGHVFEDDVCVQSPEGSASLTEVGFLQKRSQTRSEAASRSRESGSGCSKMSFLVVDQESDDLAGEPFDGILGLGPLSSAEGVGPSFSFLSQLVASGGARSTAFALHLSNSGTSQLLLGGADESSFAGGRAVWVPLSPAADGYWQFSVQDLTLDGKAQQFGSLQVAVDSGTSLLAADDDLKGWFREHLLPKDCSDVDHLPKLGLRVRGGSILSILPNDYVDQTEGKCSLALMPGRLQSVAGQRLVLGDSFLRRYTTVFDRENMRLGFGVAAEDSMAKELLPGMFPNPTTTVAPATTEGPPPPMHLDYSEEAYAPVTTPPPPTAAEIEAAHRNSDLANAFDGLGDDLAGNFEHAISHEKRSQAPAVVAPEPVAAPAPTENSQQSAQDPPPATDYLSMLK